ncbi:periplasmic heavy metal sensor [candidate division FCPU426 bacterium]|nr:periplasmic heavy metal sensor [candidate division FCPU426 bacterium]
MIFQKQAVNMVLAMLLAVLVSTAAAASFDQPPPGGPAGPEGTEAAAAASGWLTYLELQPQQLEVLKKEKTEKRKNMVKLRAQMESLQIDLASESTQDKPNLSKIEELARQMGELHGRMIAERVKSIIFLRSILTAEQKNKLDAQSLEFGGTGFRGGPKWQKKGKH